MDHALLDDVRGKLLLRERQDLAVQLGDDERAVLRVSLFDHPLNDVLRASPGNSWSVQVRCAGLEGKTYVAELVLDQVLDMAVQLIEERARLLRRAVLKDPLKHTAPVRMRREVPDLAEARIRNEDEVLGRDALERTLDDVIRLGVAGALEDVAVEFLDEADLLIDEDVLERLLDDAAPVHLERELEDVTLEDLGHRRLLHLAALLEELLDHVCAEGTRESSKSECVTRCDGRKGDEEAHSWRRHRSRVAAYSGGSR